MSVKEEMESLQTITKKTSKCESESYTNNFHKDKIFEVLQSSRNKNDRFCDIKLQTDDGTVIYGHKNILASATPYFNAMFSSFGESNKDLVNIKKLDSTILQLLIDYIYTGEIMITRENSQVLLAAADLIQLDYVKQACVEFIQKQLDPSNCLSIKVFADLHNCIELLSKCEAFIKNQFVEMVKYDEFLSLSSEEVIKLISYNDIAVPFEEKVYECVLKWVKYKLNKRKHLLSNLMEHVRLPLISKEYLLENVVNEHLLKNDPKCKDYVFEALHFNLIKSVNPSSIPETIRSKPRQLPKVGGFNDSNSTCLKSVDCYDPIQDSWVPIAQMSISRNNVGVGVLDGIMYAIGGSNESATHKSVEAYSPRDGVWSSIADMHLCRENPGVVALDGLLYVIGGNQYNSVEIYNPKTNSWSMKTVSINFPIYGAVVVNRQPYL